MANGRTARRPGTRAAETAARRRRLLAAATELAAEGGYDAVQMRDVAARA
jgi:AcrR family transcriptional regulator